MGISEMNYVFTKWAEDLLLDIRTDTEFDDRDGGYRHLRQGWAEVTEANRFALTQRFLRVKNAAQSILEIGVCRNGAESFTHCFLNNKKKETIYVGIDLEDKSFLNNLQNNIYTIKSDSSNYEENMKSMKLIGVTQFDFIFIDGWHSINQCLRDWEYTTLLSEHGIVGFHDVSYHPGPYQFIRALNKDIWVVEENVCPDDYGIGFAWKI
jgi:hypothetical protein